MHVCITSRHHDWCLPWPERQQDGAARDMCIRRGACANRPIRPGRMLHTYPLLQGWFRRGTTAERSNRCGAADRCKSQQRSANPRQGWVASNRQPHQKWQPATHPRATTVVRQHKLPGACHAAGYHTQLMAGGARQASAGQQYTPCNAQYIEPRFGQ